MNRKLTPREQVPALAIRWGKAPVRLIVHWHGVNRPTRTAMTSVLNRVMSSEYSMSLDRGKDEYEVLFFNHEDVARIVECNSYAAAEGGGIIEFRDLRNLAQQLKPGRF